MKKLRTAVVGFGYWGPHMARNISQLNGYKLSAVIDQSAERRLAASELYGNDIVFPSFDDALSKAELDAVVIATPVNSHFSLARKAMESGLHVIVEKPLTSSSSDAHSLTELSNEKGLVLLVDHTYLFTPAVLEIKSMFASGKLGTLVYFDSTRINLGLFRPEVNVLWDLAVHDLAILLFITGYFPKSVSANVGFHENSKHPAASFITLHFEELFFGHINVSWLSPMKIRRTILSGSKKTVLFDDMVSDEKIKIFDSEIGFNEASLLEYRLGGVQIPKLPNLEAIKTELEHFWNCVVNNHENLSSGSFAEKVILCLEAADESIRNDGRSIKLS